jgi:hypothetical protein
LILKYIFFPLSILFGAISALLKALPLFGHVQYLTSISVFFFINCVIATIIGAPVLLIPAIVRQRRVPACVRLAAANCLFVSVCLLVPIFTAHCVWRRQYREVNGFLLLHEYMPAAPPRQRSSVVPAHEALSVCDDEFFFVLYILDHAFMSVSPYFLPMIIELPQRYFAFTFSAHTLLFWASAVRISNVYVDSCTNHPYAGYGAEFAKRYIPLGHMMHLVICVSYLFTKLFVFSRNRERNKAWVVLALAEAASISRVHIEAIFRVNNTPTRIQTATFWSRTEFLSLPPKQPPLLLPAAVGIAFRVTSGLKDWGLYVWALSLPIYFSVFEIMRFVVDVHPLVCSVMNAYFGKCVLFVIGVIAPHYLFAKILHSKRVPSPWFVYFCCFLAIILSVHFIKPGTTRILPRNFRAFPFFIMSNVAPATILRAISHTASAKFIVVAFLALHMYHPPPRVLCSLCIVF